MHACRKDTIYDPDTGELTDIDYSDNTPDIGFSYDRLGRQATVDDALGHRIFKYNNRLQLETETITGLYNQIITRTYEIAGPSEAMPGRSNGLTLGADYTISYGFDPVTGRFETMGWQAAGQTDAVSYTRVPNSELLHQISSTGGRQTIYAYEPKRNLKTRIRNNFDGRLISQYDYQYDEIGRRTSVVNTGSAFDREAFNTYGYNDRNELANAERYLGTMVTDLSRPLPAQHRSYLYDPIGNRTQAEAGGQITQYDPANPVNQYTTITTGSDTYVPGYDADGNLQSAPHGMRYTYNAENRLIAAQPQTPTEGDIRLDFVYDYMGRRVQKAVSIRTAGAWRPEKEILFLYDGWNLIKETTIPAGGSSVDRYYVWGLDLSQTLQGAGGVGGLLAMVDNVISQAPEVDFDADGDVDGQDLAVLASNPGLQQLSGFSSIFGKIDAVSFASSDVTHYFHDGNGNVGQLVAGGDSEIVAGYEYDPFGNTIRAEGFYAHDNVFRFSTKYYDQEVNLYYYGFRYYSSELGRWINRDPIEEQGSTNLYGFVKNDGINNYDFLGQYTLNEVLAEYCVQKFPSQGANEIHTCMTTTSDQIIFDLWYQKEKERGNWWESLPRCPRKLCKGDNGKWEKPSKEPEKWNEAERPPLAEALLHPGAKWSLRSKPDSNNHANQCIYDEEGLLVPEPPGAGTVDWHKVGRLDMVHWYHDVEPIDLADYLDWGGGVSKRKRNFFHDIVFTKIGLGRQISTVVGANMAKYYEVRPLHADPE